MCYTLAAHTSSNERTRPPADRSRACLRALHPDHARTRRIGQRRIVPYATPTRFVGALADYARNYESESSRCVAPSDAPTPSKVRHAFRYPDGSRRFARSDYHHGPRNVMLDVARHSATGPSATASFMHAAYSSASSRKDGFSLTLLNSLVEARGPRRCVITPAVLPRKAGGAL
nr:hypothetical protein CFP56_68320 [Quercus suber]